MRRLLIYHFLPACFCVVPILAAALVAVCFPIGARRFYLAHLSPMDWLILGTGVFLFLVQLSLCRQALRWRGPGFNEGPDPWLSTLAQAAEWFPMLGLIGTVGGILQTFSRITGSVPQAEIIRLYAPALTATGSGLFMALLNILPTWVVLISRQILTGLGAASSTPGEARP